MLMMQDVHTNMLHAFKAYIFKKKKNITSISQIFFHCHYRLFDFTFDSYFIKKFWFLLIILYANKSIMHIERELY